MNTFFKSALLASLLACGAAFASAPTSGEIKKVDKDAGKLTIKHEAITHLNMPAMTMVFKVKEPAMLNQVKEGDKIVFEIDRANGAMTVTRIETVK